MIDYRALLAELHGIPELRAWAQILPSQIEHGLSATRWGDLPHWQAILARLPRITPSTIELHDKVQIGVANDADDAQRAALKALLLGLHPWRKGPYELLGLPIDTEWRSDWKWHRLNNAIEPLSGRLVLDVGCGNGYHCWRMLGEGARRVIGIDPSPRFVHQFYALKYYADLVAPKLAIDVLPLGIEAVPPDLAAFDTVFSMGVLYHRRSPMDHLLELKACLKPGGQAVIETLIVDNENVDPGSVLVPEGRYAKMRNVWFIPTPTTLLSWLRKCGFRNEQCLNTAATTGDEQRATDWMTFESLPNFLDKKNPKRTVEGHPAPVRGVFIANA